MNIWPWSRSRIRYLEDALATERACIRGLCADYARLETNLHKLQNTANLSTQQAAVTNRGVGMLIRTLIPNYGVDETDPTRRAESDRLSDAVVARLLSEHKASNP